MKNLIRQARLMRGMTQAELAGKVGTTAATVSRLEKDNMTVSTEWLSRFAEVLEVHPSQLLESPSQPPVALAGRAVLHGLVAPATGRELALDPISTDAVAIEVTVAQGPYQAGERLIGERLTGAGRAAGIGQDCIVGLEGGAMMLARVVGPAPKFTLVPLEPRSPILYDQRVAWLAPITIRARFAV